MTRPRRSVSVPDLERRLLDLHRRIVALDGVLDFAEGRLMSSSDVAALRRTQLDIKAEYARAVAWLAEVRQEGHA